jgi:acyl carrier protein
MTSSSIPPEQPLVQRELLPLPCPYIAPRTATERRLAEIWRAALSMDCVGADDAYNDLGGDSFLAAIIFKQISEKFGVTLPMATLVEAPTVAKLAAKIDGFRSEGTKERA